MHNLKFIKVTEYKKALDNVKKGTRQRKRQLLENKCQLLVNCHADYATKADSGNLNLLKSPFIKPGKYQDYLDHDFWVAYDLYSSNLQYVDQHWDNLKDIKNNRTLQCPLCGLGDCTEMDHFAPRSLFPEHSCNLNNLIPLCHTCNNDKGDAWLDNNNNQIFFNAFYDTTLPSEIIVCEIVRDAATGLISAAVKLSPQLDYRVPDLRRVRDTIKTLHLLSKYQEKADAYLRSSIRNIMAFYEASHQRYKSVSEYLDETLPVYQDISKKSSTDLIEKAVFKAISNGEVFRQFINALLIQ